MSNSVDPALLICKTFLANSITAICMPKHMPKKGIFFFRAKLIAEIFPYVPLFPNPPGIKMAETFFSSLFTWLDFNLSDSILIKLTLILLLIPP